MQPLLFEYSQAGEELPISIMSTLHFPEHFSGVKKKKKQTSAVFSSMNNIPQGHWQGSEMQQLLKSLQVALRNSPVSFSQLQHYQLQQDEPLGITQSQKSYFSLPSFSSSVTQDQHFKAINLNLFHSYFTFSISTVVALVSFHQLLNTQNGNPW